MLEIVESHMTVASARLITLSNEVHNVLIRGREGQVLGQDGLDVLRRDDLPVPLVEEAEALLGLLVLARFGTDASVPVESDDVPDELEVDVVLAQNVRVALLEFLLNIARTNPMEAEVLQDIPEQIVRNGVLSLLQVVIEALLQVGGHLGRQVAYGWLVWRLRNGLDLRRRLGWFLSRHNDWVLEVTEI